MARGKRGRGRGRGRGGHWQQSRPNSAQSGQSNHVHEARDRRKRSDPEPGLGPYAVNNAEKRQKQPNRNPNPSRPDNRSSRISRRSSDNQFSSDFDTFIRHSIRFKKSILLRLEGLASLIQAWFPDNLCEEAMPEQMDWQPERSIVLLTPPPSPDVRYIWDRLCRNPPASQEGGIDSMAGRGLGNPSPPRTPGLFSATSLPGFDYGNVPGDGLWTESKLRTGMTGALGCLIDPTIPRRMVEDNLNYYPPPTPAFPEAFSY